ncbi:hypothetical protein Ate01nite_41860 [Actinoplanes teichomyceticus]|nr:hypothetical protein Ate01nite_41860 [Actinoplanes teichomyceticus]
MLGRARADSGSRPGEPAAPGGTVPGGDVAARGGATADDDAVAGTADGGSAAAQPVVTSSVVATARRLSRWRGCAGMVGTNGSVGEGLEPGRVVGPVERTVPSSTGELLSYPAATVSALLDPNA